MDAIRVLIVEDCMELRLLESEILRKQEGIAVIGEASNGIEALKILSKDHVDVILLDTIMPKMDGFSLLQEIRSISMKPTPKVLVVSALARDDFIKQAIDLGANYYMVKPFDIKALIAKIREISAIPPSSIEPIRQGNSNIETMDERLTKLLLTFGIPAHILGFRYLREAIKIVIDNPEIIHRITKELYPSVGRHFCTTISKVERAMRHAIELAWNRGDESLCKVFGYKAISTADKPTNGEFIALIAEKMSREKTA